MDGFPCWIRSVIAYLLKALAIVQVAAAVVVVSVKVGVGYWRHELL